MRDIKTNKNMVSLAIKMLSGDVGMIEGARELAEQRDYLMNSEMNNLEFEDYEVFLDIEDATKDLPINKEVRKHWATDALKIKDEEIEKIEEKYRSAVRKACEILIKKLA